MQLSLNSAKYKTTAESWEFVRQVLARLEGISGVESAAVVPSLPLERGLNNFATAPERPDFKGLSVESRAVSPGYFATLGMPVLEGRALAETDGARAAPVVVVNESLARRFWPDADPIGRTLEIDRAVREVVGLVRDIREDGLDKPPLPTIYTPAAQVSDGMTEATNDWFLTTFMVRTTKGTAPADALRAAVSDVDPSLPVANVRTMNDVVRASVAAHRFITTLLAAFAAIAILLTAVGLYGVISYRVAMRTREIGIRIALGAEPRAMVALVVRDGLAFTLAGLAVGLVASLALARMISGFLFGVTATDPATYALIAIGVVAVALAACVVPARRAARVAPLVALKCE
jgi:predicted permease